MVAGRYEVKLLPVESPNVLRIIESAIQQEGHPRDAMQDMSRSLGGRGAAQGRKVNRNLLPRRIWAFPRLSDHRQQHVEAIEPFLPEPRGDVLRCRVSPRHRLDQVERSDI